VKIVIILVLVLALAGGGAFAAWKFLGVNLPFLPPSPSAAPVDENAPPKKPKVPTTFVELEPLTLPMIREGKIETFLIIQIVLDVRIPDGPPLVQKGMPYLKDRMIRYLMALSQLDIRPGIMDLPFVKSRLMPICDEVLGEGIVQDMLFQHYFQRPL
jgi:flagellar basal body-associated protein FliL